VTQLRGINPTRGRHGNSATPVTIHDSKAIIYLHKNKYLNMAKLAAETAGFLECDLWTMMREEGVAGQEFAQTSAVRRNLSVPPAQTNTKLR